jgi:DNA-binding NarL/FixJ family response regulator
METLTDLAPIDTSQNGTEEKAEVAVKRVALVDDHPIFRHGMVQVINSEPDLEVVGEANNAPSALGLLRDGKVDLILIDVCLQGANGIELTKQIRSEHPDLPILVLSMHDEAIYAVRALKAGANGFIMKRAGVDAFLSAIRKVLSGRIHVSDEMGERIISSAIRGQQRITATPIDTLTDRELEILHHIGKGRSSRQIAQELNLSAKTVESHRLRIKNRLGLRSASELVRFATDWVAEQY